MPVFTMTKTTRLATGIDISHFVDKHVAPKKKKEGKQKLKKTKNRGKEKKKHWTRKEPTPVEFDLFCPGTL